MFLFKKIIAPFFFPLPLTLILLLLGLILLWFTARQKTGKVLVSVAALWLAFCSFGFTSDALLTPLETRYSPYLRQSVQSGAGRQGRHVVVLGSGHCSEPSLPATAQIGKITLQRLVEGIRIQRQIPDSRLVLSGGGVFDPVPNAQIMMQVATFLGVNPKNIITESESRDTEDQARLLKSLLGQKPFVLVTSASHMPRAVALFQNLHMDPLPAPTAYLTSKCRYTGVQGFFPWAANLRKSERAVYECLGLAWAKLRRLI